MCVLCTVGVACVVCCDVLIGLVVVCGCCLCGIDCWLVRVLVLFVV